MINDLINFLYPTYCLGCGKRLGSNYILVCPRCYDSMPKYFGKEVYYCAYERLEGFVPFTEYHTDLIFKNPGLVRTLIHKIKYNGYPQVGYRLTHHFARKHFRVGHFSDVSMIVPVPLLRKRLHKRGYNQSTAIAKGFSKVYGLPINESVLLRGHGQGTQTKRGKEERWRHMHGAFYVSPRSDIRGKRILVVDDVLTSGATLINAGRALIDAGAESVSFYTLALDVLL